MPHTECPSCKVYFETSGKREVLECPRCEVLFPSPESLNIPEIRDQIRTALLERAANPRTPHSKNIIERLHDEAISLFISRVSRMSPNLQPDDLTVDKTIGGWRRDNFKVHGYRATATLWKGLLYRPDRFNGQINVRFPGMWVPSEIWLHKKGKSMWEGWQREKDEDRISPWTQMVLDGDISPKVASIILAPYQR